MRHLLFFIIGVAMLCACTPPEYKPNGDGTMTVIERPILNAKPVVIKGVPCPRLYTNGILGHTVKRSYYIGLIGKGGNVVTKYDAEIYVGDTMIVKSLSVYEYNVISRKDSLTIEETFYPSHNYNILW